MEIVIDFDGTVVSHEFPKIGKDIGAVPILRKLVENGHKLILFTMRSDVTNPTSEDPNITCKSGEYLQEAIMWFQSYNIPLYGIQTNPSQHYWTSSPKAYGKLIIDDAALGAPLTINKEISDRPFIDWKKVEYMLINMGYLFEESKKESRCCGRCDGQNDICITDQICENHKERGCELCFGPR